jgi:protoheme IX farnesyltransferase
LLVGVSIFATFLFALAWRLESETGGDDDPVGPAAAPSSGLGGQESPPEPTRGAEVTLSDRLYAYFRLMKPRLMWLLALVAAAAMALAAGPALSARTVLLTLGGGVLAIGASGTFNHVLERDRDRRMSRTDDRPTVTQAIPVRNAVAFGGLLGVLSLGLFLQVNLLAALLGLTAIVFYSVVYTLVLKPNTVQNTVIGGAAGALPALIGWAAVTGEVGLPGLLLAALIFVWTPAHFYNLALAYKDDYARGGFPMMPVVRGETTTRKHILLWAGLTLVAAVALVWVTPLGWLSAAASTAVGGVFVWAVVRLHREQTERAAFRAFHASNAYLGTVLLAIVVDGLVL